MERDGEVENVEVREGEVRGSKERRGIEGTVRV